MDSSRIEEIRNRDQLLAMIVRNDYHSDRRIEFFTPDDFSQQLAWMHHPAGHRIAPHQHLHCVRTITYTQEVLIVRKGKLRAFFYNDDHTLSATADLFAGDVILLTAGGHGFEVLEEVEMIEVKQGPYVGDHDKERFEPR